MYRQFNPPLHRQASGLDIYIKSATLNDSTGGLTTLVETWNGRLLHPNRFRIDRDSERGNYLKKLGAKLFEEWIGELGADATEAEREAKRAGVARVIAAVEDALTEIATTLPDQLRALGDASGAAAGQPARPSPDVILDTEPTAIRRPLALLDGTSYATTWVSVKRSATDPETGSLRAVVERVPIVVCGDGTAFGMVNAAGVRPLAELGAEVAMLNPPAANKLWRAPAMRAYLAGARPNPSGVFGRMADVFNHHLDFSRSLADQRTMCELSALAALETWFTPAFSVVSYFWPNGPWGSGKTTWGLTWAQLSYLGYSLTWGGTFAALRDLADLGAALMFDDVESLDDKRTDPDKLALLLAGNRLGVTIPVKELTADKRWVIRYVDAFAPKTFTASKLPAGALETRTIVIPLIKTADGERGNRDPLDTERWPCDRAALQDDLWALSLGLLPEAKGIWSELEAEREVVGRAFQPWRPIMAIARLLDRHAVTGLEQRMRATMRRYLADRADDSASGDGQTVAVLRALVGIARTQPTLSDTF